MWFSDDLKEFAMLFILKTKFTLLWPEKLIINSSRTSAMMFRLVKPKCHLIVC